ncbi:hypothetical protein ACTUSQ_06615 [Pantoea ananatis]|uniref:hypothetical protein n=1 Tax=Pantoea ananas TaxID=553 RepID=UPI003FA433CA
MAGSSVSYSGRDNCGHNDSSRIFIRGDLNCVSVQVSSPGEQGAQGAGRAVLITDMASRIESSCAVIGFINADITNDFTGSRNTVNTLFG